MSTKNLLILTDWYAPGFKAGGPITSIVNLAKLLKAHYTIFIVTGDRDLGDENPYPHIITNTWITGENNEQIFYCNQNKISKHILNTIIEVSNPNFIYYNSLFSFQFAIKPLYFLRDYDAKSYLSPRGMLHPKAVQQKGLKKKVFIGLLNKVPFFKKVTFLATDKKEQEYIHQAGFKNQVVIASNVPSIENFEIPIPTTSQYCIITISRIAEEKNAIGAIKAVSKLTGNIMYHWIGEAVDDTYYQEFLREVQMLPNNITFSQHGSLPQSKITALLSQSTFFFLPTHGENFGHSIYEALAAGKPSVIGENTPFADIEKYNAGFAVVSNDIEQQTKKLQLLIDLESEELLEKCLAARQFAQLKNDVELLLNQYKSIWS